jgi:uncharacterized protein (TIGR00369 family)
MKQAPASIVPPMTERTRWAALLAGEGNLAVNDTLGFTIEDSPHPEEEVVFSWTVPAELCNAEGNLQGGVVAAFADAVLGGSGAAHLPDTHYPTLAEMKISIVRPARAGMKLIGKGRCLKAGRRVLFCEAEVLSEDGKLIAKASGTEIPLPLRA